MAKFFEIILLCVFHFVINAYIVSGNEHRHRHQHLTPVVDVEDDNDLYETDTDTDHESYRPGDKISFTKPKYFIKMNKTPGSLSNMASLYEEKVQPEIQINVSELVKIYAKEEFTAEISCIVPVKLYYKESSIIRLINKCPYEKEFNPSTYNIIIYAEITSKITKTNVSIDMITEDKEIGISNKNPCDYSLLTYGFLSQAYNIFDLPPLDSLLPVMLGNSGFRSANSIAFKWSCYPTLSSEPKVPQQIASHEILNEIVKDSILKTFFGAVERNDHSNSVFSSSIGGQSSLIQAKITFTKASSGDSSNTVIEKKHVEKEIYMKYVSLIRAKNYQPGLYNIEEAQWFQSQFDIAHVSVPSIQNLMEISTKGLVRVIEIKQIAKSVSMLNVSSLSTSSSNVSLDSLSMSSVFGAQYASLEGGYSYDTSSSQGSDQQSTSKKTRMSVIECTALNSHTCLNYAESPKMFVPLFNLHPDPFIRQKNRLFYNDIYLKINTYTKEFSCKLAFAVQTDYTKLPGSLIDYFIQNCNLPFTTADILFDKNTQTYLNTRKSLPVNRHKDEERFYPYVHALVKEFYSRYSEVVTLIRGDSILADTIPGQFFKFNFSVLGYKEPTGNLFPLNMVMPFNCSKLLVGLNSSESNLGQQCPDLIKYAFDTTRSFDGSQIYG